MSSDPCNGSSDINVGKALEDALEDGVQTYASDNERADKFDLDDMVEADKYLTNKRAQSCCGPFSMFQGMIGKIRPL